MHMASIRTARVLAAVSAIPLAAALFAGVAAADNGSFADNGSNAGVANLVGSGVGRDNSGNSSTSQQQAIGSGASNQNNTAQVNGFGLTAIDQKNAVVNFADLW
ncbi:putative secreted protein [Streptomyces scabiei 87.22]|nr:putative secreted protein [Streptomyces scabiei 87.22]